MLKPENITAVIDTREKRPVDLSPLCSKPGTLATGDYSVKGLEHIIAVESKSESDLLGCVGREREQFDREVQRLLAFPVRCLVVESTWDRIEAGDWRGKITPKQAIGSLCGWMARGLPIVMAGDHQRCGVLIARLLWVAARRRWEENRKLSV